MDAARLLALIALMAVAVLHDIRERKIPNRIVVTGTLFGLASSLLPGSIGIVQSIGGLGLGLVMLLPMYALRAMGAGDVKLMAGAGAFLGINATFFAALLTFVLGGVLALLYSAHGGTLRQTMGNLKTFLYHSVARVSGGSLPHAGEMPVAQARMPYSLAIAGGVSSYLAARFYSTGAFA